jgi:hypothetical protein
MNFQETMATMLESKLHDNVSALTTNLLLKTSPILQMEETNQFGHC